MSLVGNLADLPLTDIFQIVSLSKRTGILNIATSEDKASITFLNGNVIKATSTRNKRTLGVLLKEKGLITDKDEAMVLATQKDTREPFGSILVRKKVVPRDQMETVLKDYIQSIIVELLGWEEGQFQFQLLASPNEVLPLNGSDLILKEGVETQQLIIEGLRIFDERKHEERQKGLRKMKNLGFSSLLEESPLSFSPPPPAPLAPDNTGHPTGMWESLQDEINDPDELREEPAASARKPEDLSFLEQLFLEVGEEPQHELERELSPLEKEISSLKSMVEELKGPNSLSEVLLLILRYASEFFNRAALFVVREGEVRGFGQFGLAGQDNTANDRIRNTLIPQNGDSILSEGIRTRARVQRPLDGKRQWDKHLRDSLGGVFPKEAVVLPVINNNQVIALLYGDNGAGGAPFGDVQALEIFVIQAGFVLDRFLLERRIQDFQRR